MTTVPGAGEESAITVWGKTMLAMSQKAEAAKAAKKAAAQTTGPTTAESAATTATGAEAATSASTKPPTETLFDEILRLSPHMRLVVEGGDWYRAKSTVIREQADAEIAKLEQALGIDSNADSATKYAMFYNAGAEGRDAFVKREMISYDASRAVHALSRQYQYALEHDVSPATVDPAVVPEEKDSHVLSRAEAVVYNAHQLLEHQGQAWLKANRAAINEKASVETAKLATGILTDVTHDEATLYQRFGKASAQEKEAYIQRELIRYDVRRAERQLYQQYQYAMARNIPPSAVDPAAIPEDSNFTDANNGGTREQEEVMRRYAVERWSVGPTTFYSANVVKVNTETTVAASLPVRKPMTRQDVLDANHSVLLAQRQRMGVAPGSSYYQITYTNKGQLSNAEMTAFIQEQISEAQRFADKWMPGVVCGVAAPAQPSKGDNQGVNTFRYEESHEMYLTNIALLPLKQARKALEYGEYLVRSNVLADTHLNSAYRHQEIHDIDTYMAALKDHISKLENGGSLW